MLKFGKIMTGKKEQKDKRLIKGKAMRDRILHATLEFVGENGMSKLSARSLAEKIGISKANLFHHFKNMEEIKLEACLYFLTIIRPPSFNEECCDAREFLVGIQYSMADFLEKNKVTHRGYSILCANEARVNPDFGKYIDNQVQINKGIVKRKVRKVLELDENNSRTEELLFALDVIREGVNIYITESALKDRSLKSWEKIVEIFLKEIEKER